MNDGIQIRIGDLLYAVAKRWKWVLALSFVGLGLGIALNGLTYIRGKHMNYEITCSAAVTSQSAAGTFTGNSEYFNPNDFYLAQDMVDAAEYVLRSDRLLTDAASRAGLLNADPKTIRDLLEISRYHDTQILEMTLRWNNGDEGIRLLSGILDAAKAILPETLMIGAVSVIDAPSAVYLMSGSMYSNLWGCLINAGLLMGIGIAVLDLIPMDQVLFDFISSISGDYEYVLIDAPPVGRDSDTLSLNRIASVVLFVVRYDMVTLYEIQKSIEKLDKSGTRILGCIVNGTQSFWDGGFFAEKGTKDKKQDKKKHKKGAPMPMPAAAGDKVRVKENDKARQKPAPEAAGKKSGRRGRPEAKEAAGAGNRRLRNLLEELDETGSSPEWMTQMSDEEAVSALLRMGTDGSWKQDGPETAGAYEREESDQRE